MANDAPKAPPHLRVSEDEAKECDSCEHYASGHCKLYPPLNVSGEWVCDSYEKQTPKDLKGAEKEALRVVRASKKGSADSGKPDADDSVK
jgi:hypothetical protein